MLPQTDLHSPGSVKVSLIKKELTVLIAAVEHRLEHLQDISIDPSNPRRMDAGYDEEVLEPLLSMLRSLHEKEFVEVLDKKY